MFLIIVVNDKILPLLQTSIFIWVYRVLELWYLRVESDYTDPNSTNVRQVGSLYLRLGRSHVSRRQQDLQTEVDCLTTPLSHLLQYLQIYQVLTFTTRNDDTYEVVGLVRQYVNVRYRYPRPYISGRSPGSLSPLSKSQIDQAEIVGINE